MPVLALEPDRARIVLSARERVAALHAPFDIPFACIRSVAVVRDLDAVKRGVRAPGLQWPRGARIGTWRSRGLRDFWAVASVRRPALVLELRGHEFDRVVLGVEDGDADGEALERAVEDWHRYGARTPPGPGVEAQWS
jgi:hypothetical protein